MVLARIVEISERKNCCVLCAPGMVLCGGIFLAKYWVVGKQKSSFIVCFISVQNKNVKLQKGMVHLFELQNSCVSSWKSAFIFPGYHFFKELRTSRQKKRE